MTFEDDEKVPVARMSDHVDRYKRYINKLKHGKSSGISATFGKAADLLPSKELAAYQDGSKQIQLGDDLFSDSADSQDARAALEELIKQFVSAGHEVVPAEPIQYEPLNVTRSNGDWLWTVHYDGEIPLAIETAEGTLIQRAVDSECYVMAEPIPGRKFPRLNVLQSVAVDPKTGNIFWMAFDATKAGALLSNGWKIEQYSETFFVTNPKAERYEVFNLELDPIQGIVTFETTDGATITLNS